MSSACYSKRYIKYQLMLTTRELIDISFLLQNNKSVVEYTYKYNFIFKTIFPQKDVAGRQHPSEDFLYR